MNGYMKALILIIFVLIGVAYIGTKSGYGTTSFVKIEKKVETELYCIEENETNGNHIIHKSNCRYIKGEVKTLGECSGENQAKTKAKFIFPNYTICKECSNSKYKF